MARSGCCRLRDTLISDQPHPPIPAGRLLRDPILLLACGFGTGLSPVAPGTAGTLLGVALAVLLRAQPWWQQALAAGLAILAGVWLCGAAARKLAVHDHPGIVWDEVAGYLVAVLAAPPGWLWLGAAFALFRLFDIWKPWPIREVDHGLGGGLGIMLDDVIAGCYAAASLYALRLLFLNPGV